jgi:hypothetical protein
MLLLQQNQPRQVLETLKQAEAVFLSIHDIDDSHNKKLYSLTLNNFGCYYKK